jgi:carbonic anhydrase
MRCTIIALLLILIHPTTGQDWNYGDVGPDVWSDIYETCAGRFQSPINIRTTCTTYQAEGEGEGEDEGDGG